MPARQETFEIRLLGTVEALSHGRRLRLGGTRQRGILAGLLLHPGQTVPKRRLIEYTWPVDPPATAEDLVVAYLSRLRKILNADGERVALIATRPGFRAECDPETVDAHRFTALVRRGENECANGDEERAVLHLQSALDAWHGNSTAMADLDTSWLRSRAAALENRRLEALELLAGLHLDAGQPGRTVALLQDVAPMHPERENLTVRFVNALAASGEPVRAAQVAADCTQALLSLGQEPGAALRGAHTAALKGQPPAAHSRSLNPRHQLPADSRAFTGRLDELTILEQATAAVPEELATAEAAICAIDGMGGVGKSTLAVHLAHRLADRYPDGQLFIDLHGYTQGYAPREAGDALEVLLRALGVPPGRIPRDPDERAAVYRERLAGTRTLIVLDNASSEAQVVPLLPGSPGCLVLVTSRKRLKALDDAHCLSLEPLPPADAFALFRASAGHGRTVLDGPAVEEIVALCGQLPLAVRIAAALLRHRPTWGPRHLAQLLRDEHHRIKALTDGERDLEAVFSLSYGGLTAAQRRAFQQLSLLPGPDVDVYAAAALFDGGLRTTARLLEELVDHNLLSQPVPDRYQFHDLIRIHARSRAEDGTPQQRDAALGRVLDYYLGTACSADRHLARRTVPSPTTVDTPPRHQRPMANREAAASWVRAELPNLFASVDLARGLGRRRHVVGMSVALHGYLYIEGPWTYALTLHSEAAEHASRSGDLLGQATALHGLGRIHRMLGEYPAATAAHREALELYERLDHRLGQANALDSLGRICWLTAEYTGARTNLQRALEVFEEVGDLLGQAGALNGIGRVCQLTGAYKDAISAHERALRLCRQAGDPIGQATALNDLGRALGRTGDLAAAAEMQEAALDLYRSANHRVGIANALNDIGRIRHRSGEDEAAVTAHRRALALYREMGHRLGQAAALTDLGRALCGTADRTAAAEALDTALRYFRDLGDMQGEAAALNGRAAVLLATGAVHEAGVLYASALARAREVCSPFDEAEALEGVAASHRAAGDLDSSAECLRAATRILQSLGVLEGG